MGASYIITVKFLAVKDIAVVHIEWVDTKKAANGDFLVGTTGLEPVTLPTCRDALNQKS